MLHQFDPSKVTFRRVKLKSVSTALGGSLTILNEEESAAKGKEVFNRVSIPMALARMFQVKYKVSKFFKPHEGALMMYDGKIIGIEKAVFDMRKVEGAFGEREWFIVMEKYFKTILENQINPEEKQWYFDGAYVYGFFKEIPNGDQAPRRVPCTIEEAIASGERLNERGNFRSVRVEAVHMNYLAFMAPLTETRLCIAYVANNGEFAITPPIWKQLGSNMTAGGRGKKEDNEDSGLASSFDDVDRTMAVSLNFALAAGKELAQVFGYNVIEPLQLPKLMVQLKTVNLPKMPKEIKATFDIGMTFTQAFAWLIGLLAKTETLDDEASVRRLMKYLTTKGIFRRDSLKNERIFHDVESATVPMLSLEEAKAQANAADFLKTIEDRWAKRMEDMERKRNKTSEFALD